MTKIHPTAIVEQGAEIGANVEVGPYCLIGPHVRVGDRCQLVSMVRLDGWTTVGESCRFFHGAAIGTPPQDLKYEGTRSYLHIGARNTFREFCTANPATGEEEATVIGNDNLIMAYAHIAHNCRLGDHIILANSANLAGHVEMQDYVIVGGVTPVHQFVRLGAHCIIGGGCRVPKDVPPFVMAAGHPLRVAGLNGVGLTRRGFSPATLAELKKVYRIFFRSGLVKEAALEKIRQECRPLAEIEQFCEFIGASARGLTR